MIVDAIVAVLFGFFEFILGLLPSFDAPTFLGDCGDELHHSSLYCGVANFTSKLGYFRHYVPLTILGVCLTALSLAVVGAVAVKIAIWLYDKLPFKAE